MAVQFDTAPTITAGSSYSASNVATLTTANITPSGSDRYLVASAASGAGTRVTPSQVRFPGSGGDLLTQVPTASPVDIGASGSSDFFRLSMWTRVPQATTGGVYCLWPSNQDETLLAATAYTGVSGQRTATSASGNNGGTTPAPTVNATTVADDMVVDAVMIGDIAGGAITITAGAGQAPRQEIEGAHLTFEHLGMSEELATTTTTPMSWSASGTINGGWGIIALPLIPAVAANVGTAAGTSTVAAVGAALVAAVGLATALGTATAMPHAAGVGAMSGSGTATAVGRAVSSAVGSAGTTSSVAATTAGIRTGIDFPTNGSASVRFSFEGAACPAIVPLTIICKYFIREQLSYYTKFFHAINTGVLPFDIDTGGRYFGCHPYPRGGLGGSPHDHEISIQQKDLVGTDGIGEDDDLTGNDSQVEYDKWHLQMDIAEEVSGDQMRVTSYTDLGIGTSKIVQWTTDASGGYLVASPPSGPPDSEALIWGDAPWNPGNELANGIIRGISLIPAAAAVAHGQAILALDFDDEVVAYCVANGITLWYTNQNPTATDISDKSGADHHPDWDTAARPTTVYLPDAPASAGGTGTASAVGASAVTADGASVGTSSVSGVGQSTSAAVGVASGGSTVAGSGGSIGVTTGAGVATGIGASQARAVGSAGGTSTATADVETDFEDAIGASSGTAGGTGVGSSLSDGVGAASGVAGATSTGRSVAEAIGTALSTSSMVGLSPAVETASTLSLIASYAPTIALIGVKG